MAFDLSKRVAPSRAQPQKTFRRYTTLPRQDTRREDLGVFTRLHKPDQSGAQALIKALNLAGDIGQNIAHDIQEGKDQEAAAQANLDFNAGDQNTDLFAKSRAYRSAWQKQGAKKVARDISGEMANAYSDLFNDPADPPTLEEVNATLEGIIHKHTMDERGQLLDFGTPEAKVILGNGIAEAKGTLMAHAYADIAKAQDTRFLTTDVDNRITEARRGAPIGAEVSVDLKEGPATDSNPYYGTRTSTLSAPFKGFSSVGLTGHLGDDRGDHSHNGEDFPVKDGTPITSPMSGKVVASFSNKLGGNQVRVQLDNGAIVGFAHLSKRNVSVGDRVEGGMLLGLSGSTGHATGPHVHMTVEVNGKKVSPRQYFAQNEGEVVVASGGEPDLKTALDEPAAVKAPNPFPIEEAMAELPPSIDRGTAKRFYLKSLLDDAKATGDVSLLTGLEDSKRKDGSPSFTPTERSEIVLTRDAVINKVRTENDRRERKLQGDNLDLVLTAMDQGKDISTSWIAEQEARGLLDPRSAHTLISGIEADQKSAAAQSRAFARQEERDAHDAILTTVYAEEASFRSGLLEGSSYDELKTRWQSGEFGTGKFGAANFKRLQAAAKAGRSEAERQPGYGYYSKRLQDQYGPVGKTGGLSFMQAGKGGRLDKATFTEMLDHYEREVDSGKSPEEAYRSAIKEYAAKADIETAVNRTSYLKCVRAGICN